jgi:hypothetical protein
MNIWEAYCKPGYYNVYFDILVIKGLKREDAEALKHQYTVYIQRLKNCRFASDLKKCITPESFKEKLKEIFTIKWKDNLKFVEMPKLFEDYLTFLETIQALYGDFISPEEKRRLIDPAMDLPITDLTSYELENIKDGKLVVLMNPMLLSFLKEFIEVDKLTPAKATSVCRTFYGDLLPDMEPEDYVSLLEFWWNKSRVLKKGGKYKQFKISFPDGSEEICSTTEGLKKIVMLYGFEECMKMKIVIQNNPFLVKYVPKGSEKIYGEIEPGKYFNLRGQTKDRLNVVRRINMHFGNKLTIELV